MTMTVAAMDPGRDKCGIAVLSAGGDILCRKVIATERMEEELAGLVSRYAPDVLLLGNGTTSKAAEKRLRAAVPQLAIDVVDEYRTTELARKEYWKENPPTGWRRLLPMGMQTPPVPVDDFVAVILARRHLSKSGRQVCGQ